MNLTEEVRAIMEKSGPGRVAMALADADGKKEWQSVLSALSPNEVAADMMEGMINYFMSNIHATIMVYPEHVQSELRMYAFECVLEALGTLMTIGETRP